MPRLKLGNRNNQIAGGGFVPSPAYYGEGILMKGIIVMVIVAAFCLSGVFARAGSPAHEGKEAFEQNGCTGCHKIGSNWNGPDLASVTSYRNKEWLIDFILNTKKHYEDPDVKEMIKAFNLYMPDQGVERKDAELIYEYFKSLAEAPKQKETKAGK
jgi:cytochrome c551/c552